MVLSKTLRYTPMKNRGTQGDNKFEKVVFV